MTVICTSYEIHKIDIYNNDARTSVFVSMDATEASEKYRKLQLADMKYPYEIVKRVWMG